MIKQLVTGAALCLSLLSAINANAQDQIRLGNPGYGGTGCPAGSASATLSPDQTALSIIFDQFVVEAGGITGKTIDRKNCSVAIPVHVPQGFSISIFKVDYRGFNAVPAGGMSVFNAEYFFAGMQGPRSQRVFSGPQNDQYLISDDLITSALVWSPCGADVNLRVNASMMARTNSRREQIMSTVDSADLSSGMIYHIQWRRCQ